MAEEGTRTVRRRELLGLLVLLAVGPACQCNHAPVVGPGGASPDGTAGTKPGQAGAGATTDITPTAPSKPVKGHPRLWVTAADLERLRSWAVPANPIYAEGLARVVTQAKSDMDAGKIPSAGECAHAGRYCESYAQLLGFMSLVSPDAQERADCARRARTVLMHMMQRVADNKPDDPLSGKRFSVYDRSRWAGEAFGLTVDWIYPHLSAADKKTIRTVFLRWAEEQLHAQVTSHNHPVPIGKLNDPVLVENKLPRRYAANNYFTAHMRNLGLMAMAFDAADDPAEPDAGRTYPRLRDYLANATGAWLYMTDHVLGRDAAGGLAPEGFEYAPRTLGFTAQLYLALLSAGQADPKRHGPQVDLTQNRFWSQVVPAFVHSLSPATTKLASRGRAVYEPAWSGDGERYGLLDFIDVFGPLGVHARYRGDGAAVDAARWIQTHLPEGGAADLGRRASAHRGSLGYRQAILYFLLFDPKASPPRDPRSGMALDYLAPGPGQIYARTSWRQDATWFSFRIGWAHIDHQHGDGNDFGLYRGGEWLTKERVGYGPHFEASDQHNTLCIENDRPKHHRDARRGGYWQRGSQWVLSHAADPKLVAHSLNRDYVFATGDATGLYNSDYEGVGGVQGASRSILWLKPDTIFVYDRARTQKADRFKRFWLHTPTVAQVAGRQATVTTKKGQQLVVTTLLPDPARIEARPYAAGSDWSTKPARDEPMLADLLVEPTGPSSTVEFLHVLQAADRGRRPAAVSLVTSTGKDAFHGAVVGAVAVLFPVALGPAAQLDVAVPKDVSRVLVTGLEPKAGYDVSQQGRGAERRITVRRGSAQRADGGGVLDIPRG